MNMIAAFQRQSLFQKLGLVRLFKASTARPRPRYVNIGEFSPHLQRDMGFLDGHRTPGSEGVPDAGDLATRDRMR